MRVMSPAKIIETLATEDQIEPHAMPIDRVKASAVTLRKRGWIVQIVNAETIHVYWEFMRPGTTRRVCRVVKVYPV